MNVKATRKMLGISQQRLAYQSKVSRFRIYMAEHGYLKLTAPELKQIRMVFADFDMEKR